MIKKELNPEHGKRLNECLNDKKMSQKELAKKSGYTNQYISYIVTGKKNMSMESAEIFANILEVRKEYLLCKDSYKTVEHKRKAFFENLDEINNIVLSLIKLYGGISVINSIVETEDGEKYRSEGLAKIIAPENLLVGYKLESCGIPKTVKHIKLRVELNGIQKEIPNDMLYYLQKDISEYIEFKCNKFKKDFQSL